ncbi:MAG: sulfatase-like hydrolase/transferase [bacterium]|nr:sulfatase-like hydrolase/transferase [bacterium]
MTVWVVRGAVMLALAGIGAYLLLQPPPPPPGPHVILISLDTVRADHLGCYGHPFIKTPNIDALAGESVRFSDVTTVAPTTLAAHTSIMTGTHPHTHGVPRNGFVLHEANVMLAEIMQDADLTTGAVLGSFALDRRFRFDQGFSSFDQHFDALAGRDPVEQNERRADKVTDASISFLEEYHSARVFLFVHYFDAHAPFAPPPDYASMYPAGQELADGALASISATVNLHQEAVIGTALGQKHTFAEGLTPQLVSGATGTPVEIDARMQALYCGEISYLDAQLGRLLDHLKRIGVYDRSIIILTADHGETMWEHGDFWNHGLWVYDTSIRVPLIVRLPGGEHAGTVVEQPWSTIDIFPSVLELAELPPSPDTEGRSFAKTLAGEDTGVTPAALFSEATQPTGRIESNQRWRNALKPKCVRWGRWKYIRAAYLGIEELYDLQTDPEERVNLLAVADPSPDVRARADELGERLKQWESQANPYSSHFDPSQQQETIQRLRDLGYAGAGDQR